MASRALQNWLSVHAGGAVEEAARCLQFCEAVAVALKTDMRQGLLWCTLYTARDAGEPAARQLEQHLKSYLEVSPNHLSPVQIHQQ